MLANLSKTMNISATSTVDNQIAVYFNANIQSNGDMNITQSIRNKELYITNKETVEADFKEFEEYTLGL